MSNSVQMTLHVADLEVHPDYQHHGIGRRLMAMALQFAKEHGIGTGDHPGEFTLFANVGADAFYEKLGFRLAPNGMVLTDSKSRQDCEAAFRDQWTAMRENRTG